jgi:hypothetical protein
MRQGQRERAVMPRARFERTHNRLLQGAQATAENSTEAQGTTLSVPMESASAMAESAGSLRQGARSGSSSSLPSRPDTLP